jgi:hypothetical protein
MERGDRWQVEATNLLAREPFERSPLSGGMVLTGYRIDAPPPTDRGFFETVLGTLLGVIF